MTRGHTTRYVYRFSIEFVFVKLMRSKHFLIVVREGSIRQQLPLKKSSDLRFCLIRELRVDHKLFFMKKWNFDQFFCFKDICNSMPLPTMNKIRFFLLDLERQSMACLKKFGDDNKKLQRKVFV